MIQQEENGPSTQLQSGVTLYEAQKIVDFLQSGFGILPSTSRSSWSFSTDEQFEYVLRMHNRLHQFYTLYSPDNLYIPQDESTSAPQGIDNA